MDELLSYLRQARENGIPDEDSIQDLLNVGYPSEMIDFALSQLASPLYSSPSLLELIGNRLGIPQFERIAVLALVVIGVLGGGLVLWQTNSSFLGNGKAPNSEEIKNTSEINDTPATVSEGSLESEIPKTVQPSDPNPAKTTALPPPEKPVTCSSIAVPKANFSAAAFEVFIFSCIPSYNKQHATVGSLRSNNAVAELSMSTTSDGTQGDLYILQQVKAQNKFNPPAECSLYVTSSETCTSFITSPKGTAIYLRKSTANDYVFKKNNTLIRMVLEYKPIPTDVIGQMVDSLQVVKP